MSTTDGERLDFIRDRVVHVVGHEMRTPITTVRGLAELMVDAPDDEIRDTLLPALVRNARRAERLLDDLLLAAEVRTVRPTEDPEEVDLGAIVADIITDTHVTVEGTPPAPVVAHPESARRAIEHIVSNADRYHDGPPTLRFEADDDFVTVVVVTPTDTEVADLDHVFELFFRGEAAVTRSPGLGVGLAAAKALAQLEGGDVAMTQHDGLVETRLRFPRSR